MKKAKKINFLDIPEDDRLEFHWALNEAKKGKFIKLIETYNVEINSITDEGNLDNFLINIVSDCFSEFQGSENQIAIVKYLIDNGIDINHKTKAGYNALDMALEFHDLSKISLMLIKTKNADVHNATQPIFAAIREYGLTWREEQKEVNGLRFKIIEELLKRNVDVKNCAFLIEEDEKLLELFKKYGHTLKALKEDEETEASREIEIDTNIDINDLHNRINSMDYDKTAKVIWQKLVPSSGQADTVQGELLRAIEKLRDEAHRNGNINFSTNCHKLLITFLKKYLLDKNTFNKETILKTKKNLKAISYKTMPYTEDDIFDCLTKRIIDWYLKNPKQIAHNKNEKMYC